MDKKTQLNFVRKPNFSIIAFLFSYNEEPKQNLNIENYVPNEQANAILRTFVRRNTLLFNY